MHIKYTCRIVKTCLFRFCIIIVVIPLMLCFPSFLAISYCFPWCFHVFLLVFLRFSWVFLLFLLSVPLFSILDFVKMAKYSPKMTKKLVCPTPYLRNHTSYDCHLWYTSVKWWYLQILFFFHSFKILIFWVAGRVKGQKWPKMTKNSVHCTLYIRNHTSYVRYTCVKWWHLQILFSLFSNFDFTG